MTVTRDELEELYTRYFGNCPEETVAFPPGGRLLFGSLLTMTPASPVRALASLNRAQRRAAARGKRRR